MSRRFARRLRVLVLIGTAAGLPVDHPAAE
ncbi:hypothetical protein ABIA38_002642 [Embleya sp. AB8]